MKTIDIAEATGTLSECAKNGLKEALVVTRRGKPLLAVTPINEDDWESIALADNPRFLAIIERSRRSRKPGLSTEEMRRRLAPRRRRR
jgi:PHD/YefM family antitoxin component YafN of YafNO toxin-antitoxin module